MCKNRISKFGFKFAEGAKHMASKFGKELRKIRVDYEDSINDMAKKLGISMSYLSAIEAGKRNIPSDMVSKIISSYKLSKERSEILKQSEVESAKQINIDLSTVSVEQRKLVFALSRKINDISDEECFKILEKLK